MTAEALVERAAGSIWIRHKREFPGPGVFNPVKPGDFSFRRTIFEAHFKRRSNSRKFHGDEMSTNKSYTTRVLRDRRDTAVRRILAVKDSAT